jgi:hypothetical protein
MLKRYTFWLWMAVVFMLFTGAVHSISFFVNPVPQNEIERQLIDLMKTYKNDFGAGFHPTMGNLFTALSSCFSLLCLLGGLTNAYLLRKKVDAQIMKGFVGINLLVFGICFVMMLVFTFLPPVVMTGLIVVFLILGFLTIQSSAAEDGVGVDKKT